MCICAGVSTYGYGLRRHRLLRGLLACVYVWLSVELNVSNNFFVLCVQDMSDILQCLNVEPKATITVQDWYAMIDCYRFTRSAHPRSRESTNTYIRTACGYKKYTCPC